eukprot:7475933-Pyramimonas_sp.AAC.1
MAKHLPSTYRCSSDEGGGGGGSGAGGFVTGFLVPSHKPQVPAPPLASTSRHVAVSNPISRFAPLDPCNPREPPSSVPSCRTLLTFSTICAFRRHSA